MYIRSVEISKNVKIACYPESGVTISLVEFNEDKKVSRCRCS